MNDRKRSLRRRVQVRWLTAHDQWRTHVWDNPDALNRISEMLFGVAGIGLYGVHLVTTGTGTTLSAVFLILTALCADRWLRTRERLLRERGDRAYYDQDQSPEEADE